MGVFQYDKYVEVRLSCPVKDCPHRVVVRWTGDNPSYKKMNVAAIDQLGRHIKRDHVPTH